MIIPSRLLVSVWVIIWVTTVPLFHTHLPDISDGQASQGGVAHTVFSPDLPGEFSYFSTANHHDQFAHLAKRVLNSPELDFVLSECSKDRQGKQPSDLSMLCSLLNRPLLPTAAIESRAIHRGLLVFAGRQGPRAPPSGVSL